MAVGEVADAGRARAETLDLGGLTTARGTEMDLPLWVRILGAKGTPMFDSEVVREMPIGRPGAHDDLSVIDLITVGRVTGRPHVIEIWFAHRASTIYLLSGGGHRSDWVRNLMETPAVRVRIGDVEHAGSARIVSDPREARMARDAVHDKYAAGYGSDLTDWREAALPIAIDLSSRG